MPESNLEKLVGGKLLARNAILNLLGQGVPLLVGLIAVPLLVEGLGTDRFGIMILAWLIVGYASMFDMGLGRALTQAIAARLGGDGADEVPGLAWTALTMMVALGILGALFIGLAAPWLVGNVLHIPQDLKTETLGALYMIAFALPMVIITTGLRGILEAYQRFDLVNAVRLPMGVFSFLAPVAMLPFSTNLTYLVAALAGGRLLAALVHLMLCFRIVPGLIEGFRFESNYIKPLLTFGGWITVGNLVWPLMVYMDRFIVAGTLSATAMAYYATPFEIIMKLETVPVAIMGVMFPAFGSTFENNPERTAKLYHRAMLYVFLLLLPAVIAIVLFGKTGLEVWLNTEFAANSFHVAQILAIGVFLHSFAMCSATLIQGAGRPSLTAKLQLFQLPFYLGVLWWLTTSYGVIGAASSWTLRAGVTLLAMAYMAEKFVLVPKTSTEEGPA